MNARFLILISLFASSLFSRAADKWTPSVSYNEVIENAKEGSPYFQGLLGISFVPENLAPLSTSTCQSSGLKFHTEILTLLDHTI